MDTEGWPIVLKKVLTAIIRLSWEDPAYFESYQELAEEFRVWVNENIVKDKVAQE